MSLHIHRSQRAEPLASALATMLKTPPADVFATEIVVVPARGIERWLTQRLSHELGSGPGGSDGICAGVEFLLPWQFARQVLGVPRWDAWAPDRLAWPLLQVLDSAIDEPWLDTVAGHLGRDGNTAPDRHRQGRRFAVARRLAGLFDAYAGYRPSMLTAWASGADHDGYGLALPPDLAWQPELWRRVATLIDTPNPVRQLQEWQRGLASAESSQGLPDRVSYFGPTRMTARDLQIIGSLSGHSEVHLWLPHPSPVLWERLSTLPVIPGLQRRREDRTILLPRNRLLSALGRDSRELQLAIGSVEQIVLTDEPEISSEVKSEHGDDSLLRRLQKAIAEDREGHSPVAPLGPGHSPVAPLGLGHSPVAPLPPGHSPVAPLGLGHSPVAPLPPGDRSVQVHACHGSIRQVEVLREVIVGLLADDPDLQPRDILVMCPDIDHYAPLIAATFGLADAIPQAHPGQRLRASIADRSVARTNPIVAVLQRVLTLVDGRASASEILELVDMAPVRRRYALSASDMERLVGWTEAAAVRWGLDTLHRSAFHMETIVQGTWRSGLDRILLGVTMADEDENWLSVALPVDDVVSSDIDLAGRFAQFLDSLIGITRSLAGEYSAENWMRLLVEVLGDLTEVAEADQWQLDQVTGLLADIVEEAGSYSGTTTMTLSDVRHLLAYRLRPRPTRGNFRTGGLTFCTMVPMRSVPQRIICLLGLDDGVFPRAARQDGDDILARNPVIGERDVRGEDRQLMLDALLAAKDSVVIVYSGNDERSGVERPPAVPVGELLDTLDEIAVAADGSAVREQILTRHPLQPFDKRNFATQTPFSFDSQAWSAARAMDSDIPVAPFLSSPLPSAPLLDVDLAKMAGLLQYPARGFLQQRLQVSDPDQTASTMDLLPVELDSLQRWEIGKRLLTGRLEGHSVAVCRQAEYRRGLLPPGPLGTSVLDEILTEVEPLVEASAEIRLLEPQAVGVVAEISGRAVNSRSREVRGTVTVRGDAIVTVTFSKLSPLHRLRTWIEVVALTAARPDLSVRGITIGRGSTGRAQQFTVGPVGADLASELLQQLVSLYDSGLREPLPMAARTSCAYASARRDRASVEDALDAAEQGWVSGRFPGENAEPAQIKIWGAEAPLAALLDAGSPVGTGSPDVLNPGLDAGEPSRFGQLARTLWQPLLEHEQVQWL